MPLALTATFHPTGDQPRAIAQLTAWVRAGYPHATLLGVTGSGKTFTMAGIIAETQRPTLVISPNKTLAAQLSSEFRAFFPTAAVHYFVSYYDYYQPEAYVPQTDTYIEKEAMVNEEIDRLRHAATQSLLTRADVIVVASVSCIYGLGSPEEYGRVRIPLRIGDHLSRRDLLRQLVELQFQRNDVDLTRGTFRVKGGTVEIFPKASDRDWIRIEYDGDRIARITARDLSGTIEALDTVMIFPATHYLPAGTADALAAPRRDAGAQAGVAPQGRFRHALDRIREELDAQLAQLRREDKLLEAQRLAQRTRYDLQMLEATGYVHGIENYSRHFDGRHPGEPPFTLMDFYRHAYGDQWLAFIDESHVTIPQLRGMEAGDRSRKATLIAYGFRLPSCLDNRPLRFDEFTARVPQVISVSATPGEEELGRSVAPAEPQRLVAEQLIRPTGLLDPVVEVRPTEGQIPDLIREIAVRARKRQRVLVTVLTKRMAEDLAEYLRERDIATCHLHAEVETFERMDILDDLRRGRYDVLVGINLLREGLDLPEVSLVAILDADKEGFLRSMTALIQTMGRAARHVEGTAILYADRVTESMRSAIAEVERRREIQAAYNVAHGITPRSVEKEIRGPIGGRSHAAAGDPRPQRLPARRRRPR